MKKAMSTRMTKITPFTLRRACPTDRASIAAAIAGAVMIAGCAAQAAEGDPLAADELDAYELTGETARCIPANQIRSVTALSEEVILFRVRVKDYYINRVGPGCNGADNPFRRIQYEINAGSLCRNETLRIVDNGDSLTAGFCRLNTFEQVVEKEETDEEDAARKGR